MSCLFDSFAMYFRKTGKHEFDSSTIRNLICDYLYSNPLLIDDKKLSELINGKTEDYIRKMRYKTTWGSAIEIRAACTIFRIIVIVRVLSSGKEIEFLPFHCKDERTIYTKVILAWTGSHYDYIHHYK